MIIKKEDAELEISIKGIKIEIGDTAWFIPLSSIISTAYDGEKGLWEIHSSNENKSITFKECESRMCYDVLVSYLEVVELNFAGIG